MTADQIIGLIGALTPEEQAKVVRYAYRLDAERELTGSELTPLAEWMVVSSSPDEADLLDL